MKHAISTLRTTRSQLIPVIGLLVIVPGCQQPTSPEPDPPRPGQSSVFIWLAADKDAHVSCGAGPGCPERERNFSRDGVIVVANNAVALKKSYVHFGLPLLPDGSTVETAYVELYHPGTREDGQTDDLRIPFARAAAAWDALTLTLATEPNPSLSMGTGRTLALHSQAWCGSGEISDLVRDWYANPDTNHGFVFFWNRTSPGIEKGFYSNNDVRRTVDDLGLSPRLLLHVTLPTGSTVDDIRLPPLPADNDLPFDRQTVLMARTSVGVDWPAAWDVTRGN